MSLGDGLFSLFWITLQLVLILVGHYPSTTMAHFTPYFSEFEFTPQLHPTKNPDCPSRWSRSEGYKKHGDRKSHESWDHRRSPGEDPPAAQQPSIEIRAILVRCPKSHEEMAAVPMRENAYNITAGRSEDIMNFHGFDRDEPMHHSEVRKCRRKLIVTMKLNNIGKTRTQEEFVVVDHVLDPVTMRKARLLNPFVFKVRQEQVLQLYGLKFQSVVNGEAKEEVINKKSANYTGCDDDLDNPTCGQMMFNGKTIPYSQGFCCSCDAEVNADRQSGIAKMKSTSGNKIENVKSSSHEKSSPAYESMGPRSVFANLFATSKTSAPRRKTGKNIKHKKAATLGENHQIEQKKKRGSSSKRRESSGQFIREVGRAHQERRSSNRKPGHFGQVVNFEGIDGNNTEQRVTSRSDINFPEHNDVAVREQQYPIRTAEMDRKGSGPSRNAEKVHFGGPSRLKDLLNEPISLALRTSLAGNIPSKGKMEPYIDAVHEEALREQQFSETRNKKRRIMEEKYSREDGDKEFKKSGKQHFGSHGQQEQRDRPLLKRRELDLTAELLKLEDEYDLSKNMNRKRAFGRISNSNPSSVKRSELSENKFEAPEPYASRHEGKNEFVGGDQAVKFIAEEKVTDFINVPSTTSFTEKPDIVKALLEPRIPVKTKQREVNEQENHNSAQESKSQLTHNYNYDRNKFGESTEKTINELNTKMRTYIPNEDLLRKKASDSLSTSAKIAFDDVPQDDNANYVLQNPLKLYNTISHSSSHSLGTSVNGHSRVSGSKEESGIVQASSKSFKTEQPEENVRASHPLSQDIDPLLISSSKYETNDSRKTGETTINQTNTMKQILARNDNLHKEVDPHSLKSFSTLSQQKLNGVTSHDNTSNILQNSQAFHNLTILNSTITNFTSTSEFPTVTPISSSGPISNAGRVSPGNKSFILEVSNMKTVSSVSSLTEAPKKIQTNEPPSILRQKLIDGKVYLSSNDSESRNHPVLPSSEATVSLEGGMIESLAKCVKDDAIETSIVGTRKFSSKNQNESGSIKKSADIEALYLNQEEEMPAVSVLEVTGDRDGGHMLGTRTKISNLNHNHNLETLAFGSIKDSGSLKEQYAHWLSKYKKLQDKYGLNSQSGKSSEDMGDLTANVPLTLEKRNKNDFSMTNSFHSDEKSDGGQDEYHSGRALNKENLDDNHNIAKAFQKENGITANYHPRSQGSIHLNQKFQDLNQETRYFTKQTQQSSDHSIQLSSLQTGKSTTEMTENLSNRHSRSENRKYVKPLGNTVGKKVSNEMRSEWKTSGSFKDLSLANIKIPEDATLSNSSLKKTSKDTSDDVERKYNRKGGVAVDQEIHSWQNLIPEEFDAKAQRRIKKAGKPIIIFAGAGVMVKGNIHYEDQSATVINDRQVEEFQLPTDQDYIFLDANGQERARESLDSKEEGELLQLKAVRDYLGNPEANQSKQQKVAEGAQDSAITADSGNTVLDEKLNHPENLIGASLQSQRRSFRSISYDNPFTRKNDDKQNKIDRQIENEFNEITNALKESTQHEKSEGKSSLSSQPAKASGEIIRNFAVMLNRIPEVNILRAYKNGSSGEHSLSSPFVRNEEHELHVKPINTDKQNKNDDERLNGSVIDHVQKSQSPLKATEVVTETDRKPWVQLYVTGMHVDQHGEPVVDHDLTDNVLKYKHHSSTHYSSGELTGDRHFSAPASTSGSSKEHLHSDLSMSSVAKSSEINLYETVEAAKAGVQDGKPNLNELVKVVINNDYRNPAPFRKGKTMEDYNVTVNTTNDKKHFPFLKHLLHDFGMDRRKKSNNTSTVTPLLWKNRKSNTRNIVKNTTLQPSSEALGKIGIKRIPAEEPAALFPVMSAFPANEPAIEITTKKITMTSSQLSLREIKWKSVPTLKSSNVEGYVNTAMNNDVSRVNPSYHTYHVIDGNLGHDDFYHLDNSKGGSFLENDAKNFDIINDKVYRFNPKAIREEITESRGVEDVKKDEGLMEEERLAMDSSFQDLEPGQLHDEVVGGGHGGVDETNHANVVKYFGSTTASTGGVLLQGENEAPMNGLEYVGKSFEEELERANLQVPFDEESIPEPEDQLITENLISNHGWTENVEFNAMRHQKINPNDIFSTGKHNPQEKKIMTANIITIEKPGIIHRPESGEIIETFPKDRQSIIKLSTDSEQDNLSVSASISVFPLKKEISKLNSESPIHSSRNTVGAKVKEEPILSSDPNRLMPSLTVHSVFRNPENVPSGNKFSKNAKEASLNKLKGAETINVPLKPSKKVNISTAEVIGINANEHADDFNPQSNNIKTTSLHVNNPSNMDANFDDRKVRINELYSTGDAKDTKDSSLDEAFYELEREYNEQIQTGSNFEKNVRPQFVNSIEEPAVGPQIRKKNRYHESNSKERESDSMERDETSRSSTYRTNIEGLRLQQLQQDAYLEANKYEDTVVDKSKMDIVSMLSTKNELGGHAEIVSEETTRNPYSNVIVKHRKLPEQKAMNGQTFTNSDSRHSPNGKYLGEIGNTHALSKGISHPDEIIKQDTVTANQFNFVMEQPIFVNANNKKYKKRAKINSRSLTYKAENEYDDTELQYVRRAKRSVKKFKVAEYNGDRVELSDVGKEPEVISPDKREAATSMLEMKMNVKREKAEERHRVKNKESTTPVMVFNNRFVEDWSTTPTDNLIEDVPNIGNLKVNSQRRSPNESNYMRTLNRRYESVAAQKKPISPPEQTHKSNYNHEIIFSDYDVDMNGNRDDKSRRSSEIINSEELRVDDARQSKLVNSLETTLENPRLVTNYQEIKTTNGEKVTVDKESNLAEELPRILYHGLRTKKDGANQQQRQNIHSKEPIITHRSNSAGNEKIGNHHEMKRGRTKPNSAFTVKGESKKRRPHGIKSTHHSSLVKHLVDVAEREAWTTHNSNLMRHDIEKSNLHEDDSAENERLNTQQESPVRFRTYHPITTEPNESNSVGDSTRIIIKSCSPHRKRESSAEHSGGFGLVSRIRSGSHGTDDLKQEPDKTAINVKGSYAKPSIVFLKVNDESEAFVSQKEPKEFPEDFHGIASNMAERDVIINADRPYMFDEMQVYEEENNGDEKDTVPDMIGKLQHNAIDSSGNSLPERRAQKIVKRGSHEKEDISKSVDAKEDVDSSYSKSGDVVERDISSAAKRSYGLTNGILRRADEIEDELAATHRYAKGEEWYGKMELLKLKKHVNILREYLDWNSDVGTPVTEIFPAHTIGSFSTNDSVSITNGERDCPTELGPEEDTTRTTGVVISDKTISTVKDNKMNENTVDSTNGEVACPESPPRNTPKEEQNKNDEIPLAFTSDCTARVTQALCKVTTEGCHEQPSTDSEVLFPEKTVSSCHDLSNKNDGQSTAGKPVYTTEGTTACKKSSDVDQTQKNYDPLCLDDVTSSHDITREKIENELPSVDEPKCPERLSTPCSASEEENHENIPKDENINSLDVTMSPCSVTTEKCSEPVEFNDESYSTEGFFYNFKTDPENITDKSTDPCDNFRDDNPEQPPMEEKQHHSDDTTVLCLQHATTSCTVTDEKTKSKPSPEDEVTSTERMLPHCNEFVEENRAKVPKDDNYNSLDKTVDPCSITTGKTCEPPKTYKDPCSPEKSTTIPLLNNGDLNSDAPNVTYKSTNVCDVSRNDNHGQPPVEDTQNPVNDTTELSLQHATTSCTVTDEKTKSKPSPEDEVTSTERMLPHCNEFVEENRAKVSKDDNYNSLDKTVGPCSITTGKTCEQPKSYKDPCSPEKSTTIPLSNNGDLKSDAPNVTHKSTNICDVSRNDNHGQPPVEDTQNPVNNTTELSLQHATTSCIATDEKTKSKQSAENEVTSTERMLPHCNEFVEEYHAKVPKDDNYNPLDKTVDPCSITTGNTCEPTKSDEDPCFSEKLTTIPLLNNGDLKSDAPNVTYKSTNVCDASRNDNHGQPPVGENQHHSDDTTVLCLQHATTSCTVTDEKTKSKPSAEDEVTSTERMLPHCNEFVEENRAKVPKDDNYNPLDKTVDPCSITTGRTCEPTKSEGDPCSSEKATTIPSSNNGDLKSDAPNVTHKSTNICDVSRNDNHGQPPVEDTQNPVNDTTELPLQHTTCTSYTVTDEGNRNKPSPEGEFTSSEKNSPPCHAFTEENLTELQEACNNSNRLDKIVDPCSITTGKTCEPPKSDEDPYSSEKLTTIPSSNNGDLKTDAPNVTHKSTNICDVSRNDNHGQPPVEDTQNPVNDTTELPVKHTTCTSYTLTDERNKNKPSPGDEFTSSEKMSPPCHAFTEGNRTELPKACNNSNPLDKIVDPCSTTTGKTCDPPKSDEDPSSSEKFTTIPSSNNGDLKTDAPNVTHKSTNICDVSRNDSPGQPPVEDTQHPVNDTTELPLQHTTCPSYIVTDAKNKNKPSPEGEFTSSENISPPCHAFTEENRTELPKACNNSNPLDKIVDPCSVTTGTTCEPTKSNVEPCMCDVSRDDDNRQLPVENKQHSSSDGESSFAVLEKPSMDYRRLHSKKLTVSHAGGSEVHHEQLQDEKDSSKKAYPYKKKGGTPENSRSETELLHVQRIQNPHKPSNMVNKDVQDNPNDLEKLQRTRENDVVIISLIKKGLLHDNEVIKVSREDNTRFPSVNRVNINSIPANDIYSDQRKIRHKYRRAHKSSDKHVMETEEKDHENGEHRKGRRLFSLIQFKPNEIVKTRKDEEKEGVDEDDLLPEDEDEALKDDTFNTEYLDSRHNKDESDKWKRSWNELVERMITQNSPLARNNSCNVSEEMPPGLNSTTMQKLRFYDAEKYLKLMAIEITRQSSMHNLKTDGEKENNLRGGGKKGKGMFTTQENDVDDYVNEIVDRLDQVHRESEEGPADAVQLKDDIDSNDEHAVHFRENLEEKTVNDFLESNIARKSTAFEDVNGVPVDYERVDENDDLFGSREFNEDSKSSSHEYTNRYNTKKYVHSKRQSDSLKNVYGNPRDSAAALVTDGDIDDEAISGDSIASELGMAGNNVSGNDFEISLSGRIHIDDGGIGKPMSINLEAGPAESKQRADVEENEGNYSPLALELSPDDNILEKAQRHRTVDSKYHPGSIFGKDSYPSFRVAHPYHLARFSKASLNHRLQNGSPHRMKTLQNVLDVESNPVDNVHIHAGDKRKGRFRAAKSALNSRSGMKHQDSVKRQLIDQSSSTEKLFESFKSLNGKSHNGVGRAKCRGRLCYGDHKLTPYVDNIKDNRMSSYPEATDDEPEGYNLANLESSHQPLMDRIVKRGYQKDTLEDNFAGALPIVDRSSSQFMLKNAGTFVGNSVRDNSLPLRDVEEKRIERAGGELSANDKKCVGCIDNQKSPSAQSNIELVRIIPIEIVRMTTGLLSDKMQNNMSGIRDANKNIQRLIGSEIPPVDEELSIPTTVKATKVKPVFDLERNAEEEPVDHDDPEDKHRTEIEEGSDVVSVNKNRHKSHPPLNSNEGVEFERRQNTANTENLELLTHSPIGLRDMNMNETASNETSSQKNIHYQKLLEVPRNEKPDELLLSSNDVNVTTDHQQNIPVNQNDESNVYPNQDRTSQQTTNFKLQSLDASSTRKKPLNEEIDIDGNEHAPIEIQPKALISYPGKEEFNVPALGCRQGSYSTCREKKPIWEISESDQCAPIRDTVNLDNNGKAAEVKNILAIMEFIKKVEKIVVGDGSEPSPNEDEDGTMIQVDRVVILPENHLDLLNNQGSESSVAQTTSERTVSIGEGENHENVNKNGDHKSQGENGKKSFLSFFLNPIDTMHNYHNLFHTDKGQNKSSSSRKQQVKSNVYNSSSADYPKVSKRFEAPSEAVQSIKETEESPQNPQRKTKDLTQRGCTANNCKKTMSKLDNSLLQLRNTGKHTSKVERHGLFPKKHISINGTRNNDSYAKNFNHLRITNSKGDSPKHFWSSASKVALETEDDKKESPSQETVSSSQSGIVSNRHHPESDSNSGQGRLSNVSDKSSLDSLSNEDLDGKHVKETEERDARKYNAQVHEKLQKELMTKKLQQDEISLENSSSSTNATMGQEKRRKIADLVIDKEMQEFQKLQEGSVAKEEKLLEEVQRKISDRLQALEKNEAIEKAAKRNNADLEKLDSLKPLVSNRNTYRVTNDVLDVSNGNNHHSLANIDRRIEEEQGSQNTLSQKHLSPRLEISDGAAEWIAINPQIEDESNEVKFKLDNDIDRGISSTGSNRNVHSRNDSDDLKRARINNFVSIPANADKIQFDGIMDDKNSISSRKNEKTNEIDGTHLSEVSPENAPLMSRLIDMKSMNPLLTKNEQSDGRNLNIQKVCDSDASLDDTSMANENMVELEVTNTVHTNRPQMNELLHHGSLMRQNFLRKLLNRDHGKYTSTDSTGVRLKDGLGQSRRNAKRRGLRRNRKKSFEKDSIVKRDHKRNTQNRKRGHKASLARRGFPHRNSMHGKHLKGALAKKRRKKNKKKEKDGNNKRKSFKGLELNEPEHQDPSILEKRTMLLAQDYLKNPMIGADGRNRMRRGVNLDFVSWPKKRKKKRKKKKKKKHKWWFWKRSLLNVQEDMDSLKYSKNLEEGADYSAQDFLRSPIVDAVEMNGVGREEAVDLQALQNIKKNKQCSGNRRLLNVPEDQDSLTFGTNIKEGANYEAQGFLEGPIIETNRMRNEGAANSDTWYTKKKKTIRKKKTNEKKEQRSIRRKRQIKSGGTQVRGGQDCMDRRNPAHVNPAKYQESAHCLRFSDLWYSVYELENPIIEHTVYLQLYEKHSLPDGSTHWDDLTQGSMVSLGTFVRHQRDRAPTIAFTYSMTKMAPLKKPDNTLNPKKERLLVPSPVASQKASKYPESKGGSGEYLVVQANAIGKGGNECNKAGVGFEAFATQSERCGHAKGTCLKNQPLAYWRHDKKAREAGKAGCYFLSNFATVPNNPIKYNVTGSGTREFLGLEYHSPHVSAIDIEVRADYNAIVRLGSSGRVTEVYIDSTAVEHTILTVVISNMGLASSPYQPRISDCPTGLPVSWSEAKGIMQVIPPQHDQRVTLDLYGQLYINGFHCSVEVVNHHGELVAMRRIRIQRMDRCFCVWHCLCACVGSVNGLGCQPMSPEHYHAAGFQGPVPVVTMEPSRMVNTIRDVLLFSALLILLLLFLGMLKWLVGMCVPAVARWGLDGLVHESRTEEYFEPELKCRCFITDSRGIPVHPDTRQRTVRVCSRKVEFFLNLIFFLTYPVARCCNCIKRFFHPSSPDFYADESKISLLNETEGCTESICVNTYGDSRNSKMEAEDTKYVINELKRSEESLQNSKRSKVSVRSKSSSRKSSRRNDVAAKYVGELLKTRVVFRNLREPIGGLNVPLGITYSLRGYFMNAENGGYRFITPCPFKQHWLIEDNMKKPMKPPPFHASNLFMRYFRTAEEVLESNEISLDPVGICINVQFFNER